VRGTIRCYILLLLMDLITVDNRAHPTGKLPASLGNLTNLTVLNVIGNILTGAASSRSAYVPHACLRAFH